MQKVILENFGVIDFLRQGDNLSLFLLYINIEIGKNRCFKVLD